MEVQRFATAVALYDHAESFLVAHEAENCVAIGICMALSQHPERAPTDLLAVAIEDDGMVVGVAVRTPPANIVLSFMPAEAAKALAHDLIRDHSFLPGLMGPVEAGAAFAQEWEQLSHQSPQIVIRERTFRLAIVRPVNGVAGLMRRANGGDEALAIVWLTDFEREALAAEPNPVSVKQRFDLYMSFDGSGLYVWEDEGQVVSLVAHTGATPHGTRVGPVYTPPELRGKGYASACVAALSQRMLDEGRTFCFLFTDLANPTSNHIYQMIGYEPVSDVNLYRFSAQHD